MGSEMTSQRQLKATVLMWEDKGRERGRGELGVRSKNWGAKKKV